MDYGDYEVYVVFAEDHDAAKRIAADVNRLSVSLGGGDDFASTKGRVAVYSSGEKTSAERQDQIEACLTE